MKIALLPRVSVLIVTFNHERFIAQALDGVLMQQVRFPYEIVIGEDCSTDSTRKIVEAYQAAHQDKVRLILHDKNIGAPENFHAALAACHGEYIAMLEGDDYWTDTCKLQMQVDLLDRIPKAAFCFHNSSVEFEGDCSRNYLANNDMAANVTIHDILRRWFVTTASIMFRKNCLVPLPPWSHEIRSIDWMLQMLLAARGSVHYIDRVMSVYRKHGGGWSNSFDSVGHIIRLYSHFNRWSHGKYRKTIFPVMGSLYCTAAKRHRRDGRYLRFLEDAFWTFRFSGLRHPLQLLNRIRHLFLPDRWSKALERTRLFHVIRSNVHLARRY